MEKEIFKNKYSKQLDLILPLVGGVENFNNHYNCMTRLRMNIIDKEKVKIDQLTKLPFIKGSVWKGTELQLIIGGEVYKLKDALDVVINGYVQSKTISTTKEIIPQKSLKDKFIGSISGVMVPIIPILMASGLLMGLRSILVQTGAVVSPGRNVPIESLDWLSALFYIISEVGIGFVGIFICISTVKFMGGNTIMGAFVGLAIASPYLTWISGYELFNIWIIDFKIMAYKNQLLPHIIAGIIYVLSDNWIKKWMPTTVDIVFRPFLAFLVSVISIFLILGPILSIIESLVNQGVTWMGNFPYGIGAGIFAFLWQPLVLTGMHLAVATPLIATTTPEAPNVLYGVMQIAVLAQSAAALAVAIKAQNPEVKQTAYGSIPAGLFGITEPIIYGVNLPRILPFVAASIGAGVGGLVAALSGLAAYTPGGAGLLAVTRYISGGPDMIALFFMGVGIAWACSFILTFVFYKERQSEKHEIKKANKLLIKYIKSINVNLSKESNTLFKNKLVLLEHFLTKQILILIKDFEKNLWKFLKLEIKKNHLKEKEELIKSKFLKKSDKYIEKNKQKYNYFLKKSEQFNYNEKIHNIETQISKILIEKKSKQYEYNKMQQNFLILAENIINDIEKHNKNFVLDNIMNNYYNAINSLYISYKMTERKDNLFELPKKRWGKKHEK
ncbi:PTS system, beta-glucoside-specific IIABC component [Williamsoniiplasma somnilux]|uniref:PTS system, beta-glucoside-specific IIABC component n=1 Tax=Williamsoniiplasma somnilux TaxID=215578 RepID=A0A2K8NYS5_9MOLU|nr:PTS transporter subunit EIIC [Williamsoniiplasma somnilux]ATZ18970.1 PTS system, beta-glucoside-specific IIABC component [Williamsoniiplasma somnilux]